MNYKIPFGGCSCGCGTSGNNAGGATTYKLLTSEDPVVSLKENTIAELDFSKMSEISGIDLETASDQVSAGFQTVEGRNIYVPKLKEETEYPFGVCFGAFRYTEGIAIRDNAPYLNWYFGGLNGCSEFLKGNPDGLSFWRQLLYYYNEFYGDNVSKESYGFLRARKARHEFIDFSICDYLEEFPYMMNLDEIVWYLGKLYEAGFFPYRENIVVPLTDRIHVALETDEISRESFLYFAIFRFDQNNNICYSHTVGAYTYGNSLGSIIYSESTYYGAEKIPAAFVFCQKRKDALDVYKIPLDIPSDFNNGGKTTIMLRNTHNSYLELQAVGKTFMPLQGDDLVWENLKDSYVLPILYHREGTIELETIKRGEEDTILVSEHLCFVNQLSGSSSNSSDGSTSSDEDDILDYSDVATIYSSM